MILPLLLALACGPEAPPTYLVQGVVIERRGDRVVVVDHEAIEGFMDAMIMPFTVLDPAELEGVDPGDHIQAQLVVAKPTTHLRHVQITQEAARPQAPSPPPPDLRQAVPEGSLFPRTPVMLAAGGKLTLGEGQQGRIGLTFIYSRCPVPEYCPLVVARFQALQEQLPPGARLLAMTMDPGYDSRSVLQAFAQDNGAIPGRWDFGRVPKEVLIGVAEKAGLTVNGRDLQITHDLVLVILDEHGRVVKRYHDFQWDMDEVVRLLGSSSATPDGP